MINPKHPKDQVYDKVRELVSDFPSCGMAVTLSVRSANLIGFEGCQVDNRDGKSDQHDCVHCFLKVRKGQQSGILVQRCDLIEIALLGLFELRHDRT
mmetsp:Transcript_21977/g.44454  ORF Transcript_21977/g.44454 Transcript_21977/m.44454 type:complete len:97 (-) Transcript_21977:148-438(-)